MFKKYKLIKAFPHSEEVGSIIEVPEGIAKLYPHLYAPYMFTSDDGIDVYEGETVWAIERDSLKIAGEGQFTGDNRESYYYLKDKKNISCVVSPERIRGIMDRIKEVLRETISTMSKFDIRLIQVCVKDYEIVIQKKHV
jgi:hypothetical protein